MLLLLMMMVVSCLSSPLLSLSFLFGSIDLSYRFYLSFVYSFLCRLVRWSSCLDDDDDDDDDGYYDLHAYLSTFMGCIKK
jgi:hypothetical protein